MKLPIRGEAASSPEPLRSSVIRPSTRRARVLVADPDHESRELLGRALEVKYEVIETGDGLSTIKTARALLPSLVICDVALPGLGGFEIARFLKTHPLLRRVPLIFLSLRATPEDITAGSNAGACRYVIKPFVADAVVDVVERVLDARR